MAGKAPEPLEIPDDAVLSQYGEHRPNKEAAFRDRTRIEIGETEMSLIWGRVTAEEAAILVTKAKRPWAAVRYVTAGTLRSEGFIVRHTPRRTNRTHVSVYPPMQGRDPLDWDDDLATIFEGCFTEPQGGESHA